MGLSAKQLLDLVIRPACETLDLWSPAAGELLLGTACQESNLQYLHQLGAGPAVGLWQMEPATFDDHWSWLNRAKSVKLRMAREGLKSMMLVGDADEMIWNLLFAAGMARIHYYRRPEPLPPVGNVRAQADYYKQHWNTPLGKATVEQYLENWRRYAAT